MLHHRAGSRYAGHLPGDRPVREDERTHGGAGDRAHTVSWHGAVPPVARGRAAAPGTVLGTLHAVRRQFRTQADERGAARARAGIPVRRALHERGSTPSAAAVPRCPPTARRGRMNASGVTRNVKGGLILLSIGLAAGLGMSCYAFQ